MGAHEQLESFLSLSPLKKVIYILSFFTAIFLTVSLIIFTAYKYGESNGKTQMNQQLKKETEESQIREEAIRSEAQKLAGQNDLLKAQNEAQADLLTAEQNKTNQEQKAKLQEIFDRHQQKIEEINSEDDVRKATLAMCEEYKAAGYKLSGKLCPN